MSTPPATPLANPKFLKREKKKHVGSSILTLLSTAARCVGAQGRGFAYPSRVDVCARGSIGEREDHPRSPFAQVLRPERK